MKSWNLPRLSNSSFQLFIFKLTQNNKIEKKLFLPSIRQNNKRFWFIPASRVNLASADK